MNEEQKQAMIRKLRVLSMTPVYTSSQWNEPLEVFASIMKEAGYRGVRFDPVDHAVWVHQDRLMQIQVNGTTCVLTIDNTIVATVYSPEELEKKLLGLPDKLEKQIMRIRQNNAWRNVD
jgi:hypothetical protein